MSPLTSFLVANIVPVFFVYGLAFFSMALAVMLESRRTSDLPLARAMSLLAGFGFLQGCHVWVDMAQAAGAAQMPLSYAWLVEAGRVALLATSFLFLFACGARLVAPEWQWPWGVLLATASAGLVWAAASLIVGQALHAPGMEWLLLADVLSRYLIAIPASLLTAWGLMTQQHVFQDRGMPAFGRDLLLAAIGFFLYGVIGQVFVRPSVIFPSTLINSGLFLYIFGIPVQLFQGALAVLIALTMIHALRAFDIESRQQLAAANDARLRAQQEMLEEQRKRHEETAQLNQELQQAARELTVLYDLSRILASTLELDTLLKEAVSRIAHSVEPVKAASIWLADGADGSLTLMACDGCGDLPEEASSPASQSQSELARNLIRAAMSTGCTMGLYATGAVAPIVGDAPTRRGPGGERQEMRPRMVSVPLVRKDKPIGGLLLEVSAEEPGISAEDLPLIGAMSVPLSIAVENALLYGEVKRREEARGELLHRIVSAQEAERRRVARELHDETGQALTALALGLKGTAETLKHNPQLAARQLDELRQETSEALDALRRLVLDLRPSQLDDLGLTAALRWYVEDYGERVPVQVEMRVHGAARRLSSDVESVLFRIAQEALTNVAKHADAQHVQVDLEFRAGVVRLSVTDDGAGFNPDSVLLGQSRRKAWGLLGMRERADLVNAQFQLVSQPGRGTQVIVEVPTGEGPGEDNEENQTSARG
jgi:signal transduction histidine kinase